MVGPTTGNAKTVARMSQSAHSGQVPGGRRLKTELILVSHAREMDVREFSK